MGGVILGIDPGYERCGYAAIEPQGSRMLLLGSGVLRSNPGLSPAARLHQIAEGLDGLLALWRPAAVAVEEIFFSRNAKTAIAVAQARGVILERSAASGCTVAEYSPTAVKKQLTGSGSADKGQVAYMARRLAEPVAGMDPGSLDDELDAIAVALCHAMRQSIPEALRLAEARR